MREDRVRVRQGGAMSLEIFRAVLGWAAILNILLLTVWFLIFVCAHDWVYGLHRRWFDLPRQTFDAVHYAGMAWYKLNIWMFFIIPYLALRLHG